MKKKEITKKKAHKLPFAKLNTHFIWIGILCSVIFLMLLFPPFQFKFKGVKQNLGYGFLFNPPVCNKRTGDCGSIYKVYAVKASVDTGMLKTQWICVLIIAGFIWVVTRKTK